MAENPRYNSTKVWHRALTSALGYLSLGYVTGIFTSSQTCMSQLFSWGDNEYLYIAIVSAVIPLGALFGSIFAGYLSKHYGKRKNLIISDWIMIISSLIMQIPFTTSFIIGRFTSGIAVGCFSVLSPQYTTEFTPRDVKAKIGTLNLVFAMCGSMISYIVCLPLPNNKCHADIFQYVLLMFSGSGLISLAQLILFVKIFKRESPDWFIKQEDYPQAIECLESIYNASYAHREIDRITNQELLKANEASETRVYSYLELLTCTKGTTKFMRLGVCFHVFNQLSGLSAILYYSTLLFLDLGEGLFLARLLTLFASVARIAATVFFMPYFDRLNKKMLVVVGEAIVGACFIAMGLISEIDQLKYLIVVLVYLFFLAFCLTIGNIAIYYTSEIMADKGFSIAYSIGWFMSFLLVFIFPLAIEAYGLLLTFIIIGSFSIIGSVYFAIDMVDTQGMNRAEIRALISKMR